MPVRIPFLPKSRILAWSQGVRSMEKMKSHVFGIPESAEGHSHAYAHILLPLNDTLTVFLDNNEYEITPEHLGFIAPGRFHHCVCKSDIIMIDIPTYMIKESDLETLESQVSIPLSGTMIPLAEIIKTEVKENPESSSISYLYYFLYDKLVETGGLKSLRYIKEHFNENISISDLAKLESYNISYFTDWFKRKTGQAPSVYIRKVRIDKAKELLAATNYRLIDVAMQVGYNSNASFTRAFKEIVGVSPIMFRQAVKNR